MMCDRTDRTGAGRGLARSLCRFVAIVGVAALPAPLAAQYGQSSPPPQDVPRASSSDSDRAPAAATHAGVLRAASCLLGRDAAAGNALLATGPYSPEERQEAVRTLRAADRCVRGRGSLATSPLLLRGALAETLYEAQFAQPPAVRTPPAAAAPFRPGASRQDMVSAFALADCAAARQPDLVRALMATEPETDVEGAALQALNPVFGQCVTPGATLNVDRGSIRAILAESLYRWAVVQRDGAASPFAAPPAQGTDGAR